MNVPKPKNAGIDRKAKVKVVSDWRNFPKDLQGGCLSIGNFDGVHLGHHVILDRLKHLANKVNGPSVVFTFDPHPLAILRPKFLPSQLTTMEQRVALLGMQGVDVVVVCQTDAAFLNFSDSEFFQKVVVEGIGAKAMVEGPNFFFGKDQCGTVSRLKQFCADQDVLLEIVQPKLKAEDSGEMISSSSIRKFLADGNIDKVNQYLGRRYRFSGQVCHGDGRGSKLGYPTANLSSLTNQLPGTGVYAGVSFLDGEVFPVAMNVGAPETFEIKQDRVEVHFVGLQQDLYGQHVEVQLLKKIRDVQKFQDSDQLVDQIRADVELTEKLVAGSTE